MANLVGDEKGHEVKELGNIFLYVCLLTLVPLEQGMPAPCEGQLCVGAEGSTMLVVAASSAIVVSVFIYSGNQRDDE